MEKFSLVKDFVHELMYENFTHKINMMCNLNKTEHYYGWKYKRVKVSKMFKHGYFEVIQVY